MILPFINRKRGYPKVGYPRSVVYLLVSDWLCLDSRVGQHLQELLFRECRDSKVLCLGQFAAGILTYDQVVRLLTDGTCRASAQAQQRQLDPISGVVLQFAGGHNGLAGEGVVLYFRHGVFLSRMARSKASQDPPNFRLRIRPAWRPTSGIPSPTMNLNKFLHSL